MKRLSRSTPIGAASSPPIAEQLPLPELLEPSPVPDDESPRAAGLRLMPTAWGESNRRWREADERFKKGWRS